MSFSLNLKSSFCIKLFLTALLTFVHYGCFSQRPLIILEEAYTDFNHKNYRKAATKFEHFFELFEGSNEDYYIASVCASKIHQKDKALEYAKISASDITDIAMMLGDQNLTSIHDELKIIHDELEYFYAILKGNWKINHVDSLYQKLEWKKLFTNDYIRLSRKFKEKRDTTKAMIYALEVLLRKRHSSINEAKIVRNHLQELYSDNLEILETYFPNYVEQIDQPIFMTQYGSSAVNSMKDALEAEKVVDSMGEFGIHPLKYYFLAKVFADAGEYEKASKYLLVALEKGFYFIDQIISEKSFESYLKSKEGRLFLNYLFAYQYGNEIFSADTILEGTEVGFTRSKFVLRKEIQKDPNILQIPSGFHVIVSKYTKQKLNYVPVYRNEELQRVLPSWSCLNFKIKYSSKKGYSISSPTNDEYIYLLRKSKIKNDDDHIFYKTGKNFKIPSCNLNFVKQIRSRKIPISTIPQIRRQYFKTINDNKLRSIWKWGDEYSMDDKLNALGSHEELERYRSTAIRESSHNDLKSQACLYNTHVINPSVVRHSISLLKDTTQFNLDNKGDVEFIHTVIKYVNTFYNSYGLLHYSEVSNFPKNISRAEIYEKSQNFEFLDKQLQDQEKESNPNYLIKGSADKVIQQNYGAKFKYDTLKQIPIFHDYNFSANEVYIEGERKAFKQIGLFKGRIIDSTLYSIILDGQFNITHGVDSSSIMKTVRFVEDRLQIDSTVRNGRVTYSKALNIRIHPLKIGKNLVYLVKQIDSVVTEFHNSFGSLQVFEKIASSTSDSNNSSLNSEKLISHVYSVENDLITNIGSISYCIDSACTKSNHKIFVEVIDAELNLVMRKELNKDYFKAHSTSKIKFLKLIQSENFFHVVFHSGANYILKFDKDWNPIPNSLKQLPKNEGKGSPITNFSIQDEIYWISSNQLENEKMLNLKVFTIDNELKSYPLIRHFGNLLSIDTIIKNKNDVKIGYIEHIGLGRFRFFKELNLDLEELTSQ